MRKRRYYAVYFTPNGYYKLGGFRCEVRRFQSMTNRDKFVAKYGNRFDHNGAAIAVSADEYITDTGAHKNIRVRDAWPYY